VVDSIILSEMANKNPFKQAMFVLSDIIKSSHNNSECTFLYKTQCAELNSCMPVKYMILQGPDEFTGQPKLEITTC
jgi:hypothetical protein